MRKDNFVYYLGLVTQLGLTIIACILVSLFIGLFLDRVFGTKGIFIIIFLPIGIGAGFRTVYKEILKK